MIEIYLDVYRGIALSLWILFPKSCYCSKCSWTTYFSLLIWLLTLFWLLDPNFIPKVCLGWTPSFVNITTYKQFSLKGRFSYTIRFNLLRFMSNSHVCVFGSFNNLHANDKIHISDIYDIWWRCNFFFGCLFFKRFIVIHNVKDLDNTKKNPNFAKLLTVRIIWLVIVSLILHKLYPLFWSMFEF